MANEGPVAWNPFRPLTQKFDEKITSSSFHKQII
jgi:hypothetical protein